MVDTGSCEHRRKHGRDTKEHAVSDERDSAAGDGDDLETTGGKTAVVTRPLRPSGKRSRHRRTTLEEQAPEGDDTATTEALTTKNGAGTKVKTAKKAAKGPSRNPFVFVFNYLKQVVAELRKVIWPNRKQMISYTSVVLVFLAFMVALIGVVDLGLAKLVVLVFG
jgi:preprotein translocase subunit SecE